MIPHLKIDMVAKEMGDSMLSTINDCLNKDELTAQEQVSAVCLCLLKVTHASLSAICLKGIQEEKVGEFVENYVSTLKGRVLATYNENRTVTVTA